LPSSKLIGHKPKTKGGIMTARNRIAAAVIGIGALGAAGPVAAANAQTVSVNTPAVALAPATQAAVSADVQAGMNVYQAGLNAAQTDSQNYLQAAEATYRADAQAWMGDLQAAKGVWQAGAQAGQNIWNAGLQAAQQGVNAGASMFGNASGGS
jgi:hypothetical protein